MTWIALFVFFTGVLIVALVAMPSITWEAAGSQQRRRLGALGIIIPLGIYFIGFAGSTFIASVHVIASGEVGVVRTFGNITGQVGEGLQITAPWQTVEKWDIKLRTVLPESRCGDGTEHCLDAFSSESQDVFIRAVVNLHVDSKDVQHLARTVGKSYDERLVLPRLHQIVKDTTVGYQSVDIAPNREAIRQKVRERLKAELGDDSIAVDDLLITNIDFRPDFKAAIEKKVAAEQDALTEQNKVAIAEAQARQRAAEAKGRADSIRIEAEGQAAANREINASLSPLLVQFQALQKLADNVQIALIPSGNGIIIDPATLLGPR